MSHYHYSWHFKTISRFNMPLIHDGLFFLVFKTIGICHLITTASVTRIWNNIYVYIDRRNDYEICFNHFHIFITKEFYHITVHYLPWEYCYKNAFSLSCRPTTFFCWKWRKDASNATHEKWQDINGQIQTFFKVFPAGNTLMHNNERSIRKISQG